MCYSFNTLTASSDDEAPELVIAWAAPVAARKGETRVAGVGPTLYGAAYTIGGGGAGVCRGRCGPTVVAAPLLRRCGGAVPCARRMAVPTLLQPLPAHGKWGYHPERRIHHVMQG